MTVMLFDDNPIVIPQSMARFLGLEKAIILQQIHYWLQHKKKDPLRYKTSVKEGRFWMFKTFEDWQSEYPYLGAIAKIKRCFSELKKAGYLLVGHFNKKGFDRTNWYSINYVKLEKDFKAFTESINPAQTTVSNEYDGEYQNDTMESIKMIPPIPETTTKTTNREYKIPPITPQGVARESLDNSFLNLLESEEVAQEEESKNPEHPLKQPPKEKKESEPASVKTTHAGFGDFWQHYPRRVSRAAAEKAWDRLKPDEETRAQIVDDLIWRVKNDRQWNEDNGRYIPHPSTYLNQKRWKDERPPNSLALLPIPKRGMIDTGAEIERQAREYAKKLGVQYESAV